MNATHPSARRAHTLIDVIISVVVLCVFVCMISLFAADSRRNSSITGSLSNLQQQHKGLQSYAADFGDRLFTFSWQPNVPPPTQYNDLLLANSSLQLAANQAVDIIRRRAQINDFPVQQNWIPHILYNHLVIADYLGESLPSKWAISPGDAIRTCWATHPLNYSTNCASAPIGASPRWPFSSSYEIGPAFFSPDYTIGSTQAITQASSHRLYNTPSDITFGNRRMSEIEFPSRKAMAWETEQRYYGDRRIFFMYPEARVPMLMFDGSTSVRATAAANRGFNPGTPTSLIQTNTTYEPDVTFEAPRYSGMSVNVIAHYRFTRAGLKGIDFDGAELTAPR